MNLDAGSHLGSEVLEQYSLRHLVEAECERVEGHLFICEQCQRDLADVETFITDMRFACGAVQRTPAAESLRTKWFAWTARPACAAAFAAVILAVGIPLMRETPPAGPPVAVSLAVMRGPESVGMATAERHRPLQLHINFADLPGSSEYRIQIVNQSGASVWTGGLREREGYLVSDVTQSLSSGIYWVRLFAAGLDGDPVREFGLIVK